MTIANIVLEIHDICGTDSTSFTAASMLRKMNNIYEQVIGKILCQDGNWEFDDDNYTDFPRAKADLVVAQKDYSFDTSFLAIESVEVMDSNGDYYFLNPVSKSDYDVPLDQYYETDGVPEVYDKDGKSVLIYPGPATGKVTTTNGLRVNFRRTADVFTSAQVTTGTKVPGFASPYHALIVYGTAIEYCRTNKPARVPALQKAYDDLMRDCLSFYCRRIRDERDTLTMSGISFR